MTLTITSTDQIVHVDGQPARLWIGRTQSGIECEVFISRIAVHNSQDSADFDRELRSMPAPQDLDTRIALIARDANRQSSIANRQSP